MKTNKRCNDEKEESTEGTKRNKCDETDVQSNRNKIEKQRKIREYTSHTTGKGKRLKLMSQEEKDDMENKDSEMIGGIIDENCNDKTEQTNDEDHLVNVIGCVTKQNCRQSTNEQFELVDHCINLINEKTSSTIFFRSD